ncbi:MAG: DinB family protein [Capsulimonadales bacterium]|nr:DinB family protein [Capsulimonadales bacterium]
METIEDTLRRLKQQREMLLMRVALLGDLRQRVPPNSKTWSPLQIVDHLTRAEAEYLRFIEEGEKQGVARRRPSRSPMIPILVWLMRKRISVPTIPSMVPSADPRSFAELKSEWDSVRISLIEKLSGSDPKIPVVLNPILGPMNAEQTVRLIEAHVDYHMAQIPAPEAVSG